MILGKVYDWASFQLNNGESDYSVKTEISELFNSVPYAKGMSIFFNKAISMKLNSTLLSSIELQIGDSPFQTPNFFVEISDIFLTNNSGSTANIKVLLW